MSALRYLAAALAVALLAQPSSAETTFSAGAGGGNAACGEFEVEAFAKADRDDPDRPMHFAVSVGPNGSCSGQGVAIDASASQRWDITERLFGSITASYDRHVVPVEYGPLSTFKLFYGAAAENAAIEFGGGVRVGAWTVEAVANAVDNALSAGGNLFPMGLKVAGEYRDIEADASFYAQGIFDVDLSYSEEGSRIEITASVTNNGAKLAHFAPAEIDGFARVGGPRRTYSIGALWKF